MNAILTTIQSVIPTNNKKTSGKWISFNAVCCHRIGQHDTKRRGGLSFDNDGFVYHCFNCNFKAGWHPGHKLSKNTKDLMSWMGVPDDVINKLIIEALRDSSDTRYNKNILDFQPKVVSLPENCKTFTQLAEEGCTDPKFIKVVQYLIDRKVGLDWYNWMWSNTKIYNNRVLIPYYYNRQVVGWTARSILNIDAHKYLSSDVNGYLFNIDNQENNNIVIVCEGQFDAIAVGGIAVMHNEISDLQIKQLKKLNKEIIIVPDNDKPGKKFIEYAIENNWYASKPDWGSDVKDISDAVKKFGRLYTLASIIKYKVAGEIKITMLKNKLGK